jgi:hypothetical protein
MPFYMVHHPFGCVFKALNGFQSVESAFGYEDMADPIKADYGI